MFNGGNGMGIDIGALLGNALAGNRNGEDGGWGNNNNNCCGNYYWNGQF